MGDTPLVDTAEMVYISSLALLKMLKHGRAGVPMEVMGLMLGMLRHLEFSKPQAAAFSMAILPHRSKIGFSALLRSHLCIYSVPDRQASSSTTTQFDASMSSPCRRHVVHSFGAVRKYHLRRDSFRLV